MRVAATAVATVVVAAACSSGDGTEPLAGTSPSTQPTVTVSTPTPTPTPTPRPKPTAKPPGCTFTVEPGLIRSVGTADSHVWVYNGATSFSCDNGRRVGVRVRRGSGVTVSLGPGKVSIAAGKTAVFGGYRITVTSIRRSTAVLDVTHAR